MGSSARRTSRDRRLLWLLIGALALAVVFLVASLTRSGASDPGSAPGGVATTEASDDGQAENQQIPDLSRREKGDPLALGDVDAPVVLLEYADMRCPYCAVFARDTLPKLVQEYVDTGKLRVEWRDAPIFGEQSVNAAVAARSAGRQGMFWEYLEKIYEYPGRDHQDLPRSRLIEIAHEIGVPDIPAFEKGLDDAELMQAVIAEAQQSQQIGVTSTPTFIVGQTPVMGAQPLEVFRQVIESEIAQAER